MVVAPASAAWAPIPVADISLQATTHMSVAAQPDGGTLVQYHDNPAGLSQVMLRRFTAGGAAGPATLLSPLTHSAVSSKLAGAPDGSAALAWQECLGMTVTCAVRLVRFTGAGVAQPAVTVDSDPSNFPSSPTVAFGAGGSGAVAWRNGDWGDVESDWTLRRIDAAGSLGPEIDLGPGIALVDLAVAPDGSAAALLSEDDGDPNNGSDRFFARLVGADGNLHGTKIPVAEAPAGGRAHSPTLASGASDDSFTFLTSTIRWLGGAQGNEVKVFARRLASDGTIGAPRELYSSTTDDGVDDGDVIVRADGSATFMWMGYADNLVSRVARTRVIAADGTLSPVGGAATDMWPALLPGPGAGLVVLSRGGQIITAAVGLDGSFSETPTGSTTPGLSAEGDVAPAALTSSGGVAIGWTATLRDASDAWTGFRIYLQSIGGGSPPPAPGGPAPAAPAPAAPAPPPSGPAATRPASAAKKPVALRPAFTVTGGAKPAVRVRLRVPVLAGRRVLVEVRTGKKTRVVARILVPRGGKVDARIPARVFGAAGKVKLRLRAPAGTATAASVSAYRTVTLRR
ncbi:MAG: hypothetical protein AB7I08_02220 [Thermoleophilia bacterium]